MKVINLTQGSDDWHAWRAGKSTASGAVVIMQAQADWAHIKTWSDLRASHMGLLPSREPNEWLDRYAQKGLDAEPEALRRYAPDCLPECIISSFDDRFAASLDGLNLNAGIWVEIKRPVYGKKSKMYQRISDTGLNLKDRVLPSVWWQLVHQGMILNETQNPDMICRYIVIYDEPEAYCLDIPLSVLSNDFELLHSEWMRFHAGSDPGRSDREFQQAVQGYRVAQHNYNLAAERFDAMKKHLIEVAGDLSEPVEGYGVKVMESTRKGAVDWQQAIRVSMGLTGDEVKKLGDKFRRKDSTYKTIKEVNV